MADQSEDIIIKLREQWDDEHMQELPDPFYPAVKVAPADLLTFMQALCRDYGFDYLANLSSVDYGEDFEIVYHLHSYYSPQKLLVKTRVPRNKPELPSVFSVWATADWQEREVFDLMGIQFTNHPNLVRVLLPDDFVGHPLRKDYKGR